MLGGLREAVHAILRGVTGWCKNMEDTVCCAENWIESICKRKIIIEPAS